jgi:ketosteroid isomerase-like protein
MRRPETLGKGTSEAITVVQNFWEAFNQRKLDVAMTYLANDAVVYTLTGAHQGKEEIREALEVYIQDGVTFELSEFKDEDERVTCAYKVFENGVEVASGRV